MESYFKEEVNNYPMFVQSAQERRPDPLKSAKETLKHRIRLAGGNQDLPLGFISDAESPLFFVLFEDRILIYREGEVSTEKDKVKSYIMLNFVRQNPLQQFYLLTVKNSKYLVVVTLVIGFLCRGSRLLDWEHDRPQTQGPPAFVRASGKRPRGAELQLR